MRVVLDINTIIHDTLLLQLIIIYYLLLLGFKMDLIRTFLLGTRTNQSPLCLPHRHIINMSIVYRVHSPMTSIDKPTF